MSNAETDFQNQESYSDDVAQGSDTIENSYTNRQGQSGPIDVVKDETRVEDGLGPNPDSDQALEQDDRDAIDKSNIVDSRTRGASAKGGYAEPGDEEGLPDDTGVSNTR